MHGSTRRRLIAGIIGTVVSTGCLSGGNDSDGDGVPDSEDYAPDDPDVQSRDDLDTKGQDTHCKPSGEQDIVESFEVVRMEIRGNCGLSDTPAFVVEIKNVGDLVFGFLSLYVTFYDGDGESIYRDSVATYSPPRPGHSVVFDANLNWIPDCDTATRVAKAIDAGRYRITGVSNYKC